MRVRAKVISGQDECFDVEEQITVEQFRVLVAERLSIPEQKIRLLFQGRFLGEKTKTLKECGVEDGYVIHVVEQLENTPNLPNYPDEERLQRGDEPRRRNTGGNWSSRRVLIPPVRSMISVVRSGELTEPERFEAIVRRAISELPNIPDEIRAGIRVEVANGSLTVNFPAFNRPHVPSPALERMFAVDRAIIYMRHFRKVAEASDGPALLIDRVLEGEDISHDVLTKATRHFTRKMDRFTEKPVNLPEYDCDDQNSAAYQGRYQHLPENGQDRNSSPYVARHALASDLVNKHNSAHQEYNKFHVHLERYNRILSSNYVFEIENHENLTTDGRANLFCAYAHHVQKVLHRYSHLLHLLSDVSVKLEDPLPRRLHPQNDVFQFPNAAQGQLSFEIINPTDSRPAMRARQQSVNDMFRHPNQDPQAMFNSMISLYPTGFTRRTTAVPIGISYPVAVAVRPPLVTRSVTYSDTADTSSNSAPRAANAADVTDALNVFRSLSRDEHENLVRSLLDALAQNNSSSPSDGDTENIYEQFYIRLMESGITAIGRFYGGEMALQMMNQANTEPSVYLPHIPSFGFRHVRLPAALRRDLSAARTRVARSPDDGMNTASATATNFIQDITSMLEGANSILSGVEIRIEPEAGDTPATGRDPSRPSEAPSATTASFNFPMLSTTLNGRGIPIIGATSISASSSMSRDGRLPTMASSSTDGNMPSRTQPQVIAGGPRRMLPFGIQAQRLNGAGIIPSDLVPVDPFLNCDSRLMSLGADSVESGSHYEQIISLNASRNRSLSRESNTQSRARKSNTAGPSTSSQPPPDPQVFMNQYGDVIAPESEEEFLRIIQHAIRWILFLMRDNDVSRVDQVAGRSRQVFALRALQSDMQHTERLIRDSRPGNTEPHRPFISATSSDAGSSSSGRSSTPASDSTLGVAGRAGSSYGERDTPPTMEEVVNVRVPEQGTSPRAKKRKTEPEATPSTGAQSSGTNIPRNVIPPNRWREIVERDMERQRVITVDTSFSRGYQLGHPSFARTGGSMTRSSSITGMVDTLDHLSVRSIPQSPQTATLDFMDETD